MDTPAREFDEFVAMAAHNLRESLRDVTSYSQLIAETCGGSLDSDAGLFLARIRHAAETMQSLLTDMVNYSAMGTGEPPSSPTEMEAVLCQVLLCADKQIAERGASVTHDVLPKVYGDFATLTKVLHHLIRNAIDFCEASSPCVHISCKREDPDWVFSVEDNGPGIDPAFQGRVFRPFQRLHEKVHQGNGLGLAFCKKAIEWHGGRMWMESTPGAGAAFYFTLSSVE